MKKNMRFSKNIKIIKSQSAGVKYKFTAPQRLHTDKLVYAYLVGLIEADPVGFVILKTELTSLLKWV